MFKIIYYIIHRSQPAARFRLIGIGLLISLFSQRSELTYATSLRPRAANFAHTLQHTQCIDSLARLTALEDLRSKLNRARKADYLPDVKLILEEIIRMESSDKQEYLD